MCLSLRLGPANRRAVSRRSGSLLLLLLSLKQSLCDDLICAVSLGVPLTGATLVRGDNGAGKENMGHRAQQARLLRVSKVLSAGLRLPGGGRGTLASLSFSPAAGITTAALIFRQIG